MATANCASPAAFTGARSRIDLPPRISCQGSRHHPAPHVGAQDLANDCHVLLGETVGPMLLERGTHVVQTAQLQLSSRQPVSRWRYSSKRAESSIR